MTGLEHSLLVCNILVPSLGYWGFIHAYDVLHVHRQVCPSRFLSNVSRVCDPIPPDFRPFSFLSASDAGILEGHVCAVIVQCQFLHY